MSSIILLRTRAILVRTGSYKRKNLLIEVCLGKDYIKNFRLCFQYAHLNGQPVINKIKRVETFNNMYVR